MIPVVFALAVVLASAVSASSAPLQTGASRLVLAAATDLRNHHLVDVGPDDFVITEGNDEREVLSVRVADYPIVVMLDTGAGARNDFPLMQKAIVHFIERLGADRPVSLVAFGNTPRALATFDDDRRTVMDRLGAAAPDADAGSQLLAGAALAARTLHATGSLFSAVVVVSATAADMSRIPPEEALGATVDSGAIVHVVANRRVAADAADTNQPARTLQSIAEQTHGEFTTIYAAASYQAALDRLADRLSSELLIEYLVPPGSKPSDVKVGIRVPGARVRGLGVAPR